MPCSTAWLVLAICITLMSDSLLLQTAEASSLVTVHSPVFPDDSFGRKIQGSNRALHQEEKESEEICDKQCVTVVRSESAFESAVYAGAVVIEIRSHLNLTELKHTPTIDPATKAIRGNCSDPVPDFAPTATQAPLLPLEQGQCLLFNNKNLLTVKSSNLWLDNLYVRYTPPTQDDVTFYQHIEVRGADGHVWTTNTTLQGNGDGIRDCWSCGVYVTEGAKFYAEDTKFVDLDGHNAAVAWQGFGNFVRCTFANNTLHNKRHGASLIESDAEDEEGREGAVRLEQCTIRNNTRTDATIPTLLTDNRAASKNMAAIYSDDPTYQVCNIVGDDPLSLVPACDNSSPLPLAEAGDSFLTMSHEWINQVQVDLGLPPSDPTAAQEGGRSSDTTTALLVGGVIVAVLLCMAGMCAVIVFKRRRHHRATANSSHAQKNTKGSTAPPREPMQQHHPNPTATWGSSQAPPVQHLMYPQGLSSNHAAYLTAGHSSHSAASELPGVTMAPGSVASASAVAAESTVTASGIQHASDMGAHSDVNPSTRQHQSEGDQTQGPSDTFDMTQSAVPLLRPPGPKASHEDKKEFLEQQLDSFNRNTPIFDDLLSLGRGDTERRQGGQAIVQMAMQVDTMQQFAIKFFVSSSAFSDEFALYRRGSRVNAGSLAQFLPKVLKVYPTQHQHPVDAYGYPLPPCIVMERGESLDLWAERSHPDKTQAFSVMSHVAMRLKELHALGYVHRDLKPGNVMWLPRENRWTMIDFGCVARTGREAKVGFTISYAAPEVIAAYRRGDRTMVAQESQDVWSLGVMAFELLTGKMALRMTEGRDKVMDRIEGVGGMKLPWEGTLSSAVHNKLGVFRKIVLQLIARDPAERPSMKEFCDSCDRVLAGTSAV